MPSFVGRGERKERTKIFALCDSSIRLRKLTGANHQLFLQSQAHGFINYQTGVYMNAEEERHGHSLVI
jgi:hypothetical protein